MDFLYTFHVILYRRLTVWVSICRVGPYVRDHRRDHNVQACFWGKHQNIHCLIRPPNIVQNNVQITYSMDEMKHLYLMQSFLEHTMNIFSLHYGVCSSRVLDLSPEGVKLLQVLRARLFFFLPPPPFFFSSAQLQYIYKQIWKIKWMQHKCSPMANTVQNLSPFAVQKQHM